MKTKSIATLIAAASCGLIGAVTAAPAAAATGTALSQSTPGDPGARRVCRRMQPTGSRLAERVCRTQREWDEIAQATRDGKESAEREDTVGHNPALNGTNPIDRRGNPN